MKYLAYALIGLIAWDLGLDWYYDRQEEGYTRQQVKAVDTIVASLACDSGDWLCRIDTNNH